MKYVLKLTTDNNVIRIPCPEKPDFRWLGKEIGCEWIEVVHPRNFKYSMIVDEEGLLKEAPMNMYASLVYGIKEHGQPIAGTALIMKEEFGEDGYDLVGIDEDEAVALAQRLFKFRDGMYIFEMLNGNGRLEESEKEND